MKNLAKSVLTYTLARLRELDYCNTLFEVVNAILYSVDRILHLHCVGSLGLSWYYTKKMIFSPELLNALQALEETKLVICNSSGELALRVAQSSITILVKALRKYLTEKLGYNTVKWIDSEIDKFVKGYEEDMEAYYCMVYNFPEVRVAVEEVRRGKDLAEIRFDSDVFLREREECWSVLEMLNDFPRFRKLLKELEEDFREIEREIQQILSEDDNENSKN